MAIENRNLEPGTKLVARYKGETYTAEVVQTEDGIRYRTADGKLFKSPSKAGSHVMKGVACNGWRFWSREGELPEPRPRQNDAATKPGTPKRKANPTRLIRRLPNQKGLAEGTSRWWCSSCMASFIHEEDGEPATCHEGHPREAAEEGESA